MFRCDLFREGFITIIYNKLVVVVVFFISIIFDKVYLENKVDNMYKYIKLYIFWFFSKSVENFW